MVGSPGKRLTWSMPSNPNSPEPGNEQQDGLRRLYGRRQAFKLRGRQAELVESLLPQLEVHLPEEGELDLGALFPGKDEIHLEIGFGGGEHLYALARVNPNAGFIGAEPFINGVATCLGKIEAAGVENVRIHAGDARDLLDVIPHL